LIPIELKPFSDEAISSWIIRNAIANGSDPSSWADGIWPEWRIWTRDIDRSIPTEKAYELSKITSLSLEEIKGMTLEPDICRIEGLDTLNIKSKWKWVVPTGERGSVKTNGIHFCPECLSDPVPYLRKQWRLSWNTVCSRHKCHLLLHCPSCNGVFLPNKIDYQHVDFTLCVHCGFDLKKASTSTADVEMVKAQKQINKLLYEGSTIGHPFNLKVQTVPDFFTTLRMFVLFFRRLHHFESHQKSVLEKIGISDIESSTAYIKGEYFDSLSVETRSIVIKQVISFLQLPIEEMVYILKSSDVSQQMFCGEVPFRTDFINEILHCLEDRSRRYPKRMGTRHTIQPKSKEEVLAKMEEIRDFI